MNGSIDKKLLVLTYSILIFLGDFVIILLYPSHPREEENGKGWIFEIQSCFILKRGQDKGSWWRNMGFDLNATFFKCLTIKILLLVLSIFRHHGWHFPYFMFVLDVLYAENKSVGGYSCPFSPLLWKGIKIIFHIGTVQICLPEHGVLDFHG